MFWKQIIDAQSPTQQYGPVSVFRPILEVGTETAISDQSLRRDNDHILVFAFPTKVPTECTLYTEYIAIDTFAKTYHESETIGVDDTVGLRKGEDSMIQVNSWCEGASGRVQSLMSIMLTVIVVVYTFISCIITQTLLSLKVTGLSNIIVFVFTSHKLQTSAVTSSVLYIWLATDRKKSHPGGGDIKFWNTL